jgi:hypothetical protein
MFRDFKLLLDPPPLGFYTYEDTVSGILTYESPRDEPVGWVYVFFHGWANTNVVKVNADANAVVSQQTAIDKEVLFQYSQKVYQGNQKLQKNILYRWPFQFEFQTNQDNGASLPSPVKYGCFSSVEYRVIAITGHIGQEEENVQSLMNPDDPLFIKLPHAPSMILPTLSEYLGGTADTYLQFVQVRPYQFDAAMLSPFVASFEISGPYLSEIMHIPTALERHGLLHAGHDGVPFSVMLRVPQNIVDGAPFPMLLSVTSPVRDWIQNPPPVNLTGFQDESALENNGKSSTCCIRERWQASNPSWQTS